MSKYKILVLTKYGRLGASSRIRFIQYFSLLTDSNFDITVSPMVSDFQLLHKYKFGSYKIFDLFLSYLYRIKILISRKNYDLLWIEKEALQWTPTFFELFLLTGVPYILDYDDAVFHNYDQNKNRILRFIFGGKLDRLMKDSSLVIAGNRYLELRAKNSGAKNVVVIPSVIDLDHYKVNQQISLSKFAKNEILRIVWIGTPSTVHYLKSLSYTLHNLSKRYSFELVVIGGGKFELPGVSLKFLDWTEESETDQISSCDIGIMPLSSTPWELGKCGYKLIQYMACSLPVVASNIGANSEIVLHGVNGYLANSHEDWESLLSNLLDSDSLRKMMGSAGRSIVENQYSVQSTFTKYKSLFEVICLQHREL